MVRNRPVNKRRTDHRPPDTDTRGHLLLTTPVLVLWCERAQVNH